MKVTKSSFVTIVVLLIVAAGLGVGIYFAVETFRTSKSSPSSSDTMKKMVSSPMLSPTPPPSEDPEKCS